MEGALWQLEVATLLLFRKNCSCHNWFWKGNLETGILLFCSIPLFKSACNVEDAFKQCLWKNFGAAIDMLSSAISLCPDEQWPSDRKFFYMAYHTVIFLDYYLTYPVRDFQPLLPYTLADLDQLPPDAIDDVIPARFYTKAEMLSAIVLIREKGKKLTLSPTDQLMAKWIQKEEIELHGLCPSIVEDYTVLEILFYNLRHVQHHVAQLNWMLRQNADRAAKWVSHAE